MRWPWNNHNEQVRGKQAEINDGGTTLGGLGTCASCDVQLSGAEKAPEVAQVSALLQTHDDRAQSQGAVILLLGQPSLIWQGSRMEVVEGHFQQISRWTAPMFLLPVSGCSQIKI